MDFDVAIVGAGPAGSAAALQLRALEGGRNARICLIDKAEFPRPKLCGGGITSRTEELLACLGVSVTVPFVPVTEVRFVHGGGTDTENGRSLFKIVRREQFDESLVREVCRRGVELISGDAVRSLRADESGVRIEFASGRLLHARMVIGADGANSTVRRQLVPKQIRVSPFIALEVLTPGHDAVGRATFDFTTIAEGVKGYVWDFPSLIDGKPFMNRGIASIGEVPERALHGVFADALRHRGIDLESIRLEGAWAPVYDPLREQSAPRVVLAGDAVGIDPWLGEGISSAIGTGILAGHVAAMVLESGDFAFEDHRERIASSAVGEAMATRMEMAARFYGTPTFERVARMKVAS
jgi:flavin-dependent dehydrogenase